MNKFLQTMKQAIIDYNETSKTLETRYQNAKLKYNADALQKEREIIEEKRNQARQKASETIRQARDEALQSVQDWGTVHGEKLTDDLKLLEVGVTPKQFNDLVDRYKDNYSMLQALTNYGNRRNAELTKESRGIPSEYYSVDDIPTPKNMIDRWTKIGNEAIGTLPTLDNGNPYNDTIVENWGENVNI